MTDQLRAAAQALLDAVDARHDQPAPLKYTVPYGAVVALRAALSAPQPAADERVAEQAAFEAWCPYRGSPDPRVVWAAAWAARALLAAGREDADADLFKLLDIAAHHFTEGHYGWPSTDTRAAILAHWRAGKPPVPSVFDAELLQAINDPNRDEGTP